MRHKEAKRLVDEIKGDLDSDQAEPILKQLALGAFINLARIADALDKPKP